MIAIVNGVVGKTEAIISPALRRSIHYPAKSKVSAMSFEMTILFHERKAMRELSAGHIVTDET